MAVVAVSVLQGGSMAARWWRHENEGYKVSNYETDDKAELMEKNFGNEGEDEDTF